MDFIVEMNDELFLNKNNDLYNFVRPNICKNLNYFFKNISEDNNFKLIGGVKNNYLSVVPTFINIIKGKIIYNNKSRMELQPMKPVKKDVILGTIFDLKKIKMILEKESINKEDLIQYISKFDVIPLFFNFNNEMVLKNKKKYFFSKDSSLILVLFKVKTNYDYFYENSEDNLYDDFRDISDVLENKNFAVAHYIYENFYIIINKPDFNLEIYKYYYIDINQKEENKILKEIKTEDFTLNNNDRKISINEMILILNLCVKKTTIFN